MGDESYEKTLCLTAGKYIFILRDSYEDGFDGSYTIFSNREGISGGRFSGSKEIKVFEVLFLPSPSQSPSISLLPTSTLLPLTRCFFTNFMIVYGAWPEVTSFVINQDEVGTLFEYQALAGDCAYDKTFCLTKGKYSIVLCSLYGHGFAGTYTISSNGDEISGGGFSGFNETILFEVLFLPLQSESPSVSLVPTSTLLPSFRPSTSLEPTTSQSPIFTKRFEFKSKLRAPGGTADDLFGTSVAVF